MQCSSRQASTSASSSGEHVTPIIAQLILRPLPARAVCGVRQHANSCLLIAALHHISWVTHVSQSWCVRACVLHPNMRQMARRLRHRSLFRTILQTCSTSHGSVCMRVWQTRARLGDAAHSEVAPHEFHMCNTSRTGLPS